MPVGGSQGLWLCADNPDPRLRPEVLGSLGLWGSVWVVYRVQIRP